MDIAVVIPKLVTHGGAERYALECMKRWTKDNQITLYTSALNNTLLEEAGLIDRIRIFKLTPMKDSGEDHFVLDRTALPRRWTAEIGLHEVYNLHLFPTNLVDKHPSVWCAQEPLRIKHDLRYAEHLSSLHKDPLKTTKEMPNSDHSNLFATYMDFFIDTVHDGLDRLPDVIVANSQFAKKQLDAIYKTGCKVVYPGVSDVRQYTKPSGEKIILSVSSTSWAKRVELIINAMRFVDGARLVHLGTGTKEDTDYLKSLVKKWNLGGKVDFTGEVPDRIVNEYMRKCFCIVFVPLREPFGITPLEAAAYGKPVICADEGGYTEVINDSCAFIGPPYPHWIADSINMLLRDPRMHEKMGNAGISIAGNYTWDNTARQLMDIIKGVNCTPTATEAACKKSGIVGFEYLIDYRNREPAEYTPAGCGDNFCPWLGYYKSYHGATIERHLKWLENAGIDFVSLEVPQRYYPDTYFLQTADTIFRVAESVQSNLMIGITLYPENDHPDVDYLRMIMNGFTRRKNYLRIDQKPVVFVRSSSKAAGDYGRAIIINITGNGEKDNSLAYVKPDKQVDVSSLERVYRDALSKALKKRSEITLVRGFNTFKTGYFIEPVNILGDKLLAVTAELLKSRAR